MSFNNYEAALTWAKINGRENCRPCDKWTIEQIERTLFKVAIRFKASNEFVGYAY